MPNVQAALLCLSPVHHWVGFGPFPGTDLVTQQPTALWPRVGHIALFKVSQRGDLIHLLKTLTEARHSSLAVEIWIVSSDFVPVRLFRARTFW